MMHLSQKDRARLHAVEHTAAARTQAQFALVAVHISDRYGLYPLIYAAVAGMTVLGALALFWPELSLRSAFYAAAITSATIALLLDWLPLRLLCVPRHAQHARAREMAHRAFAARVLAQTDHRPGIIFFVSLAERYVEVVTDRDVDLKVPQKVWDAIIADFTDAARKGHVADGLAYAIGDCIRVLETHYPPKMSGPELIY